MPGDDDSKDSPAAVGSWLAQYISQRYGPPVPEETEVTCAGGLQLPTVGAGDGE